MRARDRRPDASTVTYAETDAYPDDLRALLPTTIERRRLTGRRRDGPGSSLVFDTSEALVAAYPRLDGLIDHAAVRARAFVPVGTSGVPAGVLITSSGERARSTRRPSVCSKRSAASVDRRSSGRSCTAMRGRRRNARRPCRTATTRDRRGHDDRQRSTEPAVSYLWTSSTPTIGALVLDRPGDEPRGRSRIRSARRAQLLRGLGQRAGRRDRDVDDAVRRSRAWPRSTSSGGAIRDAADELDAVGIGSFGSCR